MPGFAELLQYLAAIDAKGKAVEKTMDRVAASLPAEPVTDALALRRSNAATPVGDDAPALVRILGQMRAASEGVAEVERTIESLSVRAGEVSEEVAFKISKALSAILDPGNGPGLSGNFDKGTGQFLGGAFSNEYARDLVEHYGSLLDASKTARAGIEQFLVNQAIQQTANHFRQIFGPQLGDIKKLLKELRAYEAATAKKDAATGPTSGTLARPKPASGTTTSIAVLRWSGGLR